MGELFGAGPEVAYEARCARLVASRVAVWDVLAAGERAGSLDSAIVPGSVVVNEFGALFARQRSLELICFNGAKAAELYRRRVLPGLVEPFVRLPALVLPSTSPANAGVPYAAKLERWSAALVTGTRP